MTNRKGQTVAVQLTPEEFKNVESVFASLRKMRKDLQRAIAIHKGVESALLAVQAVESGHKKARTLKQVLVDL